MTSADPKRDFAVDVVRTLKEAGFTALWAGGCVRDLLLRNPPDDYDVATSARPEEVQKLFGPRRTLAIGASFGVILVRSPRGGQGGDVEVATFRTEGPYVDGRRPEHVSYATPEEDAHRRDFTINGMFYDPLEDQLHDFVGGRDDIARQLVRAIGNPQARFTEDKLRMLRAVRISARFDFELEAATADAVRGMAPEILVVSQERIAQELKKMLVHPRRARAISLAHHLELLTIILPELTLVVATAGAAGGADRWHLTLETLEILKDPRFELAFAALLSQIGGPEDDRGSAKLAEVICRRLKLSNQEADDVAWLASQRSALRGATSWSKCRLKRLLAQPAIGDLLKLARAGAVAAGSDLTDIAFCEAYLATTPREEIDPPPLITGDDLVAIGLQPGAQFKELLDGARDAQLDSQIQTREEALALVRRLAGL